MTSGADAVDVLRSLIRFDTTNPPGNEADCIGFVQQILERAGIETTTFTDEPGRPNLVARVAGEDASAPVLLQGHVDVAPTAGQQWRRPPFSGALTDGFVWGRGALDMKGGLAMMISALVRLREAGVRPAHDLILAVLSDEESGGDRGARFMVEKHPEVFRGVRYGIGEFGGFSMLIGGRRFYPVQVAEKRTCRVRATIRRGGGHGAFVHRGGTTARLARLLGDIDRRQPPMRATPVVREMLARIIAEIPTRSALPYRALLQPRLSGRAVRRLGPLARLFEAMLRNTVTATVVRAGEVPNVVPANANVLLDVRVLPGCSTSRALDEIAEIVGDDVELEIVREEPSVPQPDLGRLDVLAEILRELDPEAVTIPFLQIGGTDARHFARLGIQMYGFVPLQLPQEFDFLSLVHAADERVPVDALRFGAEAMARALVRI